MSFFDIPEDLVPKKPKAPVHMNEVTQTLWTDDEKDAPEVMALVRILQALKPIFKPVDDEDRRPFVHGAWFSPSTAGHGYLVATNSNVLVAVRIPEKLTELLRNPTAIRLVADLSDLQAASGEAVRGNARTSTCAFGLYGWKELPGAREFPDWVTKIPTTHLDQEWTAKFDPEYAVIIDDAVSGALKALGKEAYNCPVVTRMLGDAQNNTTPRVYASPDVLAILMPLIPKSETIPAKQAVLDFVKEAR